jgi:cell division protein FtsB
MSPSARRLVLTLVPALLLGAVGLSIVFGHHGLLRRQQLRAEVRAVSEELGRTERENHRLLLELAAMDRDPLAVERAIAEEIGRSRDGAVLYRFDD